MSPSNVANTGMDHQSLFGGANPSDKDYQTQLDEPQNNSEDQPPASSVDSPMEGVEQNGAGIPSADNDRDHETCSFNSAFSIFAPSIQMLWLDDVKKYDLNPGTASYEPEYRNSHMYSNWRKRYGLTHDTEGRDYPKPTNAELCRDIIPFDLLKDLLTKLTIDSLFAIERARCNFLKDNSIPEDVKADAPTLYDLPLQRQSVVKQSLLESVPYPGLLPPERWTFTTTKEEKENAPTIETSGIDTFLRITRALAALGMPTYVQDRSVDSAGMASYCNAVEAAIWTELGREPEHDWRIKQAVLKFNRGSMKNYLAIRSQRLTSVYWELALSQNLWSKVSFKVSSQKLEETKAGDGIWMPNSQPIPVESARLVQFDRYWARIDCYSNKDLRHSARTIQDLLCSFFSVRSGVQIICDFPDFLQIKCGGGKGRLRQQVQPCFILNGVSVDPEAFGGYRKVSCLYKLKIVWRISSEDDENELRHETRRDDYKIWESEAYQALLHRAQDPEQLPTEEGEDDQDWTLETSSMDYSFIVFYHRVGRELIEEGFQEDWESDPAVKRMYPEHSPS